MREDPVVRELRDLRQALDARFVDSRSYYEHLCEYQKQFKERLIHRGPQPALKAQTAR